MTDERRLHMSPLMTSDPYCHISLQRGYLVCLQTSSNYHGKHAKKKKSKRISSLKKTHGPEERRGRLGRPREEKTKGKRRKGSPDERTDGKQKEYGG